MTFNAETATRIAFLAVSFKRNRNGRASIFGFLYQDRLPKGVDECKALLHDLMLGRCIQMRLTGTTGQVEYYLLDAASLSDWTERFPGSLEEGIKLAKQNPGGTIGLESLEEPFGGGIPALASINLRESAADIEAQLAMKPDVLELSFWPGTLPRF